MLTLIRICPSCNDEIKYTSKGGYKNAVKNESVCKLCQYKKRPRAKPISDETRRKMSESHRGMKNHFFGKCHSEETKKHLREVHPDFSGEKNPFYGKTHSIETRKQMSESRANGIANGRIPNKNGFGTKSWYHSTKTNEDVYCDSLLEKFRMIQLDHDPCVTYWTKKHHIKIQYLDTKQRNYVPDFLITLTSGELILEEIKGYDIRANVKYEALKRYCLEHGLKYNWIDQAALENEGYRKFVESQR